MCDIGYDSDASQSVKDDESVDTKGSCSGLILADIPGLLEGAHDGRGLGTAFLKHIQKCRVLLHVIDGSSDDPVGDLMAIKLELKLFNPNLLEKIDVVVVNKYDLPQVKYKIHNSTLLDEIKGVANHSRVTYVSAINGYGVTDLMRRLRKLVHSLPVPQDKVEVNYTYSHGTAGIISYELQEHYGDMNYRHTDANVIALSQVFRDDNYPDVIKGKKVYRVVGKRIEQVR